MAEITKMTTSRPPTIARSSSEAELLKHVGSETNLVDLAEKSNLTDKNDATASTNMTSVQYHGRNSQIEATVEKRVMSYGAFCAQNPNSTRKERREAMQAFYSSHQSY